MSDFTTTITMSGTDYTINIDDNDDSLTHTGYIHYNKALDVYLVLSYKTHNQDVLDHTIHQIGTEPTIEEIPPGAVDCEGIRDDIQSTLDYSISDEQLDAIIEVYQDSGRNVLTELGLKDEELYRRIDSSGYISTNIEYPLDGWDFITEDILDDIEFHPDDERNLIHSVFNAIKDNTPGDHEYVAQLQCNEIEPWRLRALELYQDSFLSYRSKLCKVQALREQGLTIPEISDILDTQVTYISHQLYDIDLYRENSESRVDSVTDD
jgi:hypothetical protein